MLDFLSHVALGNAKEIKGICMLMSKTSQNVETAHVNFLNP